MRSPDNLPAYTATDEHQHQHPPDTVDPRELTRTPSPTPSEEYALTHKTRDCDLKRVFDFKKNPRQIWTVAVAVVLIVLLILFLAFQRRIEDWLRPFADWMHDTPGGWLIPIALMFVLSFPPLFGHEIVAVLCGDVWGVWIGFGIVAAGTVLGELGGYIAFRYMCRARATKVEETKLKYALLVEVVRRGGWKIPIVMRFSAIPGHLLTAIFSTLGMSVWTFLASAIVGLPKQLAVVYIGVSQASDSSAKEAKIIKAVAITVTVVITHLAMIYIYKKMDGIKEEVVYKRRKARQTKVLAAAAGDPAQDGDSEAGDALSKAETVEDIDLERGADGVDSEPQAAQSIPMSTITLAPTPHALPSPSPHRSEPDATNPET
ncbi:hypothetical protein V8D89_001815 [Ganoderma adspersum]